MNDTDSIGTKQTFKNEIQCKITILHSSKVILKVQQFKLTEIIICNSPAQTMHKYQNYSTSQLRWILAVLLIILILEVNIFTPFNVGQSPLWT